MRFRVSITLMLSPPEAMKYCSSLSCGGGCSCLAEGMPPNAKHCNIIFGKDLIAGGFFTMLVLGRADDLYGSPHPPNAKHPL